jgi:hypothetical protein
MRLPLGHEPLGLEPFDALRVSSSVEKLGAERLEAEWLRSFHYLAMTLLHSLITGGMRKAPEMGHE